MTIDMEPLVRRLWQEIAATKDVTVGRHVPMPQIVETEPRLNEARFSDKFPVLEHLASALDLAKEHKLSGLAEAVADAVLRYGLHIKNYPSCGATHLVIEACQTLRNQHQIILSDVVSVEAVISDIARSVLPYGVPKDRTEALFSVPWCAAVALADGDVGVTSFQPDALLRPELLDLAARVSVKAHPRSPGLAFHPDFPDTVTVRLKDGRSFCDRIAYPIGSPQRPLPHDNLKRKFLNNVQCGGLSKDVAEGIFERIFEAPPENTLGDLVVN